MIPVVRILKERPIERGHWLYAVTEPGRRRKDATCMVVCSCGERLAWSDVDQYQEALDLSARNHKRRL